MPTHRRTFDRQRSLRLDWAIMMTESTRGWRRRWWRLVKRWLERGI
jgi:hypothetical protein